MTEKEFKILPILIDALEDEFNEERKGIHVSDLIYCPRKSVFTNLDPMPKTMRELNFFSSGKGIHVLLQGLAKKIPDIEIEKKVTFDILEGTIDAFIPSLNIPIEIKTARLAKMDKVKKTYVDQLKAYMALTGSDYGIILVQLITHFDDKPFLEFPVYMTEKERKDLLDKLICEAYDLKKAIVLKKPEIVRHIYNEPEKNFLCWDWKNNKPNCPYFSQCKTMRNNEKTEEPNLENQLRASLLKFKK